MELKIGDVFEYVDTSDLQVTHRYIIKDILDRQLTVLSQSFYPPTLDAGLDEGDECKMSKQRFIHLVSFPVVYIHVGNKFDNSLCTHEYKLYQGFTNTYEYCVKCDEKRI